MLHKITLQERVDTLNDQFRNHAAHPVLEGALQSHLTGKTALVSSFGAESVVLLHMVALIKPETPVLFVDTELLFPETLEYQQDLAKKLGLTNIIRIKPAPETLKSTDPYNALHMSNTDLCCHIRKVEPLNAALKDFDSWITGRKRHQAASRATLDLFENEDEQRIKINPLAHWRREDVIDYIDNNKLPRHPLISKGYPSIGCAPCTSPVKPGEDPRAGRWRSSEKVECGIHLVNGTYQKWSA